MGFTKIYFSSYKAKHKRGVAILISNKVTLSRQMNRRTRRAGTLTKDSRIFEKNNTLYNKIKEDLVRRNLTPYLSLS